MAQLLISLGATKKQIVELNKIEAKNYLEEIKKPAVVLCEDEKTYKEDKDFTHLSYHLLSNVQSPSLILVERKGASLLQSLQAVLARLVEGLLIIDMPSDLEQCKELFDLLGRTGNKKVQIVVNLQSLQHLEESLHKIHTGWRLFHSISKKDYDWLIDNIGELDAVGLTVTGALRDEYISTYKNWCKSEKRKQDPAVLAIPFYYSLSKISIKPEVFKELIGSVMEKLKIFGIEYSSEDVTEMYL